GAVVALGDPIYNRADPRLTSKQANAGTRPMELARLVGSGREVESCANVWRTEGYDPVLLEGERATRANLVNAMRRNPRVLHIAAHMLFPRQDASPGMIALSLSPDNNPELLGANEIAAMRLNLGLVVLNGCSSGHAAVLPGTGLMGM